MCVKCDLKNDLINLFSTLFLWTQAATSDDFKVSL